MRMRKAMEEAHLKQPEFELKGMFSITLDRPEEFSVEIVSIPELSELSDTQKRVLELIEAQNAITVIELAGILSRSERHVQRLINQLRDTGYIEREGSDKTGIWTVLKK
jgi:ATP-dependent DNA helicase RecG